MNYEPFSPKVIFHCLPVLRDVIEPSSIDIDVKWFADGENILSQVLFWVTHTISPSGFSNAGCIRAKTVEPQTFNAGSQASSSLPEDLWHLGQTIHCSAQVIFSIISVFLILIDNQAKHTIVGARTEKIESDPHFAGLQVSGTPVTLVEGGQVATLVLTATVPVLCSPQVPQS